MSVEKIPPHSPEKPVTEEALVSVVIVNYNGKEFLADCLTSVFEQPHRPLEVIVVDNASTDGSLEMIRRQFPLVRLVVNSVNRGFAGGNNDGCDMATGEYIVLLNNDTVVEHSWLPGLLKYARRPEIGAAASFVTTDGIPPAFYEMNGTLNYLGYNIMRHFSDVSQIFYAGGTSMMFRRNVSTRPFLDEYFLYHEDVYYSWKLRLAGFSVVMAPGSKVKHLGSATTKRALSSTVTFYQERNRILNALFFFEKKTLILLSPWFVSDAFAKILLAVLAKGKSLRGLLRAYWWLMTNMDWIRKQRTREQAGRKIADAAILQLMSAEVIDTARWQHVVARMVNSLAKVYAALTGLPYHVADQPHGR
ncbi:MAG: glycosyltransferase family 2 protein [Bacteroidota bacterium]